MVDIGDGFARKLRASHINALDGIVEGPDSRAMQPHYAHVHPRVIFGVATALGCFSGFQAYYYVATFTEWPASLPFLLALNLGYWYSWACLTPAILWLSRRAPFERSTWVRAFAVHIPGVFIATVAHIALTVGSQIVIVWAAGQQQRMPWLLEAQNMFFSNFDWEMMTYWAIVGFSHALRYYSEARDRELRESSSKHTWSRRSCRRCSGNCSRTSCSTP